MAQTQNDATTANLQNTEPPSGFFAYAYNPTLRWLSHSAGVALALEGVHLVGLWLQAATNDGQLAGSCGFAFFVVSAALLAVATRTVQTTNQRLFRALCATSTVCAACSLGALHALMVGVEREVLLALLCAAIIVVVLLISLADYDFERSVVVLELEAENDIVRVDARAFIGTHRSFSGVEGLESHLRKVRPKLRRYVVAAFESLTTNYFQTFTPSVPTTHLSGYNATFAKYCEWRTDFEAARASEESRLSDFFSKEVASILNNNFRVPLLEGLFRHLGFVTDSSLNIEDVETILTATPVVQKRLDTLSDLENELQKNGAKVGNTLSAEMIRQVLTGVVSMDELRERMGEAVGGTAPGAGQPSGGTMPYTGGAVPSTSGDRPLLALAEGINARFRRSARRNQPWHEFVQSMKADVEFLNSQREKIEATHVAAILEAGVKRQCSPQSLERLLSANNVYVCSGSLTQSGTTL